MTSDSDEIDFREMLEQYADNPLVTLITMTLLSGDKYTVVDQSEIVFNKRVVSIVYRHGGESFFPFEAICNVDVRVR